MTILLATLNARYHHCAFGLRYLLANMGELRAQTCLVEFTIQQPALEIVAEILSHDPQIVGFGVYIWNVTETTRVIADLKRLRPEITVIVGGPEVSYEIDDQEICRLADHVITGEADLAFADACRRTLGPVDHAGGDLAHVIHAPLPDLNALALPYDFYSDEDLAQRVIYVEASRGCPFTCEFCLSALEIPVRQLPLDRFLTAMERLLERGARQFKFVDRTFNLNLKVSRAILEFFLNWSERSLLSPEGRGAGGEGDVTEAKPAPRNTFAAASSPSSGLRPPAPSRGEGKTKETLFLHFEMIPDRLPEALKETIARFPPGALQFEIGIQTFNEAVGEIISRKQDNRLAEKNIRWLRAETPVHLHTDLIVGLPGESLESFAAGFDRLVALGPQEIQVGILKRLRGTPIIRHDAEWGMVYSPHPPYEVLQTKLLDFATLQELRRLAKVWDLVANSGNFRETLPWILGSSPFAEFRRFSAWLFEQAGQTHGLALTRLLELVFRYLTERQALEPETIAPMLLRDYHRGGRSDTPVCLREWMDREKITPSKVVPVSAIPSRQRRHQ